MACKSITVSQKTRLGHPGAIGPDAMTMEPYTDPKYALVQQNMVARKDVNQKENLERICESAMCRKVLKQ